MGFESQTKPLKQINNQIVNFKLQRASFNLEEIVIVPGENPADVLLRKIIANKKRNSNRDIGNYSYEAYNKVELDLYDWNDKFENRKVMRPFQFVFDWVDSTSEDIPYLPAFLSENLSDYYYRSNPSAEREIIKASKQSGLENESISQFLGSLYQEVNIYDNWPVLLNKNFVSPIADGALNYYKYYLVDSSFIDGIWCYKLNFTPKGKGSFTFLGDLWVADSSYAIKKISMEAADHVNVNFVDKISMHQEYSLVEDSVWMMSKDKLVVRFKVMDRAVGFIGRKTTTFKDYKINLSNVDEYFETKIDVIVDENAFTKDEAFWLANRHEELSRNEAGVYDLVDSLKNTKAFNTWVDIVYLLFSGYYEAGWFEFGPYISLYSYNTIEAHRFRFGFRTSNSFSKRLQLGAYGAYGLRDREFKYGFHGLLLITKKPRQSIGFNYMSDLDLRPNNPAQFGQDNLLTGLIRRKEVPQKFMFVKEGSAFYEKEWKVGYSNRITVRHRVLSPFFDFKYLNTDNSHADTIRNITVSEATFKARFAYHEKFLSGEFDRFSLGSKYPIVMVFYTIGLRDIVNSEYDYHRVDIALKDNIPINPIGTFKITLMAGKIFGDLPYLLLQVHQGNETYFYNSSAFNLMNEYEFVSDMYASLSLKHHFEGFFLNKIPGIRKLKWRTLVSAKAVIGNMTEANKEANALNTFTVPFPRPYVEVGAGIENIFKLFEVDAIWRLTYRDAPNVPKFGIRFGMEIEF